MIDLQRQEQEQLLRKLSTGKWMYAFDFVRYLTKTIARSF
jgi:hypothetical protein